MAFDDSLIGSNDFDPKTATEDLVRRVAGEPLPDTLDPRMLNTRLARKLGREPVAAPEPETPKTPKTELDFSSQAAPASNMEPGGKDDLDFTSQVTPQAPAPSGMNIGGPTALAKGLVTGAPAAVGGAVKGAARMFGAGPGNPVYDFGQKLEGSDLENIQREQLGLPPKPPLMSQQEKESLTGRVGTMAGGIAPYAAAGAAGGAALGMAAGFVGLGADVYGKVYEDAKAKGADDATAATAAKKSAVAAGILGSLPLGTGKLAQSIVGKVVSQGLTFAGTNEATEYVLQEIAKDYDEHAGYTPEAKRIIASLITGGMLGGLHAFERKPSPEAPQGTEAPASEPPSGSLGGPDETTGGPDAERQRQEQEARNWQRRGWDDQAGQTGSGPQPGPQGGPQGGGAKAKPEAEQKPGAPPKGEGEDIPDDYTMEPDTRAKMERVFRAFERGKDPSKMTDAELFRAVNDHLRDTSSTGYTAKEDTAQEKAQREQHQTKQTEDAELKQAFGWMTDAQIASMTPDMRAVWLNRARGTKPAREQSPESADVRGNAPTDDSFKKEGPTSIKPEGTREAPIAAKTEADVRAAQPVEPKSAAQAEAENYQHAHLELEHLGLSGKNSISVETGVGQTRKGPPGPDGKPEWEVKMEQGAYGRIKGTKGADGQPLDIMVGPHPSSPHVFIINQHDPETGKFDELKVQAGYRTPLDAMHAYAISYNDHAQGRIGGMVAMSQDQFRAWLKYGDHTKAVQHGDAAAVLARAFPEAGNTAKSGTVSREGGVESIATSGGLHNAPEVARRPLTEASAETSSPNVPKGSQGRDANEAIPRPAATTTQNRVRSEAGENYSLLEFLADRGGLKPHPELEAIGFGGMHRVQIPGRKGFFGLIKQNGWDLDTAREAAEEAGYLQGDTSDATSTIRHLLDAMDTEARGTKLYPHQGEGQRTRAQKRTDEERAAYEEEQHQRYYAQAHEEIAAEYPDLPRDISDTAARMMVLDGVDRDTAVEYAAIWEVNRDNELYEQSEHSILETFGPEATDAIQAVTAHADGAEAGRDREQEDHAGGAEARASDGRDVQEARAERGEAVEGRTGEGTGRAEAAGEAEPVREPARAEQRAAGREQAAGDEGRDAARYEPAAENADHAEGGIAGKIADVSAEALNLPKGWTAEPLNGRIFIRGPNNMPYDAAGIETTPRAIAKAKHEIAQYAKDEEPFFYRGAEMVRRDLHKPKKPKSVDDLTAAEKKAHRDAPTWAQVLAELPMHKDGRTHQHEIAFEIMKEIAPKARQKFDNLTPEQKGELYERVKARKPDLWKLVEAADNALSGNAARVIERWVGGPPGAAKAGATHGFFDWKPLEEAMATDGQVAKDIAAAFKPVKDWLRDTYGKSITLHRYERAENQPPGRTLYSYTLDQSGMEHYANAPKERPLYTEAEIAALETEFAKTGNVKIPRSPYSLERQQLGNVEYIAIMDPSVGGEVTDTGSVREFMDERNAVIRKNNEQRAEALKGAKTETIPLDQIVWVTDRFHQQEFIVRKPPVTTEKGADNKEQAVIPGAEKASDKTMAQRKADAALKPKVAQKGADIGLFGDERNQTDMFSTPPKKAEPPKDEIADIFDNAITEHFAKPVSLDDVAKGLQGIFGKKPPNGLAESEAPFSDETYQQALPYFKAGMSSFADAGDVPAMAKALVSYLANAGLDADAMRAMKPYFSRFIADVRSGKETLNAPSRREVLERDRANAAPENGVGAADVSAPASGSGRSAGAGGGEANPPVERPAGGERLPQDYAPVVGERGNLEVPEREPVADERDDAGAEPARGADGGEEGFSFDQRADDEAEADAQRDADVNARRKAQAEADAKRIPVKLGDLENIAATLPMLFPEQHADVKAAEDRFAKADGHGMLFTNGTGTGKTYSGLGIIKRFALQGKKQAIVIAPSQGILMDWQRSAKDLGLDMHILDSTVDKGRPGLNGTTYANFGDNPTLADQEWDLVVPDEAHKLSSDQDGTTTKALRTLRALTYHPDGLMRRAEMVFRREFDQIKPLSKNPDARESAAHAAAVAAYNAKAGPAAKEWRARKRTNKAVFLSATPFAYHFSLDWAEGYLFNFPEDTNSGAYNAPTGRDQFYIQHLGYRKRVGKLTKPDAEVKQEVMERELHEYLRKSGSLAGRMLTVDKDYDRKFVLAHDAIGNQIDQALNFLQDNEQFRPLVDYVQKKFDYLTRMRLLEAIKARAAIDYINQSLALGRKVVVFHDYNEGGGINPFDLSFDDKQKVPVYKNGKHEDVALKPLYEEFVRQNPYVKDLKFADYPAPIETLTSAFPKALVYNGTVSKKKRDTAKALFNDDSSGHDIIIVQSAAGEAGISLHDTTGKHQRVTLNLGMPIRPVSSIQQEGRIYRVGQASDALFRYMNTGTDWERWTFAGKIADRAGTAENLALGNQARTIRQAFIDAFANAEDYRPEPGEGTGGKAADRAVTHSMSEFEKAKTHYYAQAKNNAKRQNREGVDYYATPEPVGFKMVEWGNVKSGEKMLEPSAGHGAIARYFPEDTHRTLVEPSSSLASRASLNSTGARVVVDRFENLDIGANKQDVIVMNPPFGRSGADARDHVIKAVKHLKNGGRIIALVPDVAVEKIDGNLPKDLEITALISLPPVTFERAGTGAKTTVMVIDKQADQAVHDKLPYRKHYDLSNAATIGELFDRLENLGVPDRLEPETKEVEVANGNVTINGVELKLTGDSKGVVYADIKNKLGRDVFAKTAKMAEKNGGRYSRALKSFEFPNTEARQKFLDMLANPPKEEAPTAPSGVTFKNGETVHGKTGKKVFVASPDQRVERAVYDQMNAAAKAAGGYYSSFTGRGAIPGFQFPSEEARAQFLKAMGLQEAAPDPFAQAESSPLSKDQQEELARLESIEESRPLTKDQQARLQALRLMIPNFAPYQGYPKAPAGARAQQFTLERGRARRREQLVAFDADGNVVADHEGLASGLSFGPALEKLLLDPDQDLVLHHNHPRNRSFSATDIGALAAPGLRTIWAHGHGGAIYRANLTPEARRVLPVDVKAAAGKLAEFAYAAEKGFEQYGHAHYKRIGSNEDFRAEFEAAWHHFANEMLREAGIIEYETNFEPAASVLGMPKLSEVIRAAADALRKEMFGAKGPTAAGRLDRRPESVRHPGNVGVSFDRAEVAAAVNPGQRGAAPRGGGGLAEAEGSDLLPGLEEIDRTFNDLLGRRLLGRLGDLNATEMRVQLQDKFARIKNVEKDKGNTSSALSAYQAESLYYGRTGQRLESLKEHVVDPIIREMKGRDIDLDSMDKFLYARHAPERNNAVGQLYPDSHDFKRATRDPRVKGASGMSTGEANSYIGRLRAAGKLADYQAVGRMVDALNLRTRRTLLDGGLIDRETFDALNSQYSYYVPLRGWQEGSNEDELPRPGKGMDTRARAFKQAFGRESLAASPMAYSIMQAEQAIVKAEKNKVGNTFLKFAQANPDPDLWTINRPTPRKVVSKSTGMVHNTPTWDMNKPNVFVTRVSGKAVLIEFKGKDGGNLARALKDMGSSNMHSAVRMMAAVTHTMARLATAWNPEFMIPNLVRDVGEAFINLGEQRQRTFVRKFAANIIPAMKGSWMAIAEKSAAPGSGAQRYIDAFHEFDREGGRVRFFGIDDPDVIEKNVEKRLKRLSGGAFNSVKDLGEKAGKALEIMGGGIENATRLAAYMAARDVGMSPADAAMLARNLTVNFNKKGELGSAIGSAYMFANAGVQGQARMVTALNPKHRRVWMAVGALATAGVMSTSFNLGIGGYDQAGQANYMKIPSWERDKNIIIMGPGETYGKIPLPYGFAPFHVLGSHATTVLMGQEKPAAAAAAVFGSIASAFNPLGEEDSLIATVVPTALRPAVHIHYNENWTGKPLYPARDSDKGRPESQQSFRTDTAASKTIAEGLNSLTGGDRYTPGAIDIHPGSLDHVFGAITGGVGKFFKNIVDTVINGWNGQPWEASKTPILRRFVGKIDHNLADSAAYYDARKEATEEANRVRQAKRDLKTGADEQAARAFLDATPAGRQKMIFDRADQQMRRLRAEEARIANSPQPYEAKRAALDAIRGQMRDVQNRARAESARLKGQKP